MGALLLGRRTYEHFADVWTSTAAAERMPEVTALLNQGLVDELRILLYPVLLGRGRSLYAGLKDRIDLTAGAVTARPSGNVLLRYRPPGRAGNT
ncbi:dihydrofolate reductase family protein [Streptomyces pseudovenezuelae]|uniref:Dihydrofolate reductase n=1 Tax=Streptomyces pseudovenezuelae TaxID=67350 RepID=A0ABT6M2E0_9ACTN|nr:dihydrofolate reductase family protein [Streptomyces pseudovenezuelae]MDH6222274.1 dihydrofolate reductase [Streptomyces pseudovenezuelae]